MYCKMTKYTTCIPVHSPNHEHLNDLCGLQFNKGSVSYSMDLLINLILLFAELCTVELNLRIHFAFSLNCLEWVLLMCFLCFVEHGCLCLHVH